MRDYLTRIGFITSDADIAPFHAGTRDDPSLTVMKHLPTGARFLNESRRDKDYYGAKTGNAPLAGGEKKMSTEEYFDTRRRLAQFERFVARQRILDFGCGSGSFLKAAVPIARSVAGVEPNASDLAALAAAGIAATKDISDADGLFDTVFAFHSFEHLDEPLSYLKALAQRLVPGTGRLVIEVPHAGDFLIQASGVAEFRNYTFWSEHLILHSRASLAWFFRMAGLGAPVISGYQRYSFANHLGWLIKRRPGGHMGDLAVFDSDGLNGEYAKNLQRLDQTDTLIAVYMAP